jgi:hypothetical protein
MPDAGAMQRFDALLEAMSTKPPHADPSENEPAADDEPAED